MNCAVLLEELDACADAGLLRSLGCAFARFIASLSESPPALLLGCVILSELEGRGDSCLVLADLELDPIAMLRLPPEDHNRVSVAAGPLPETLQGWADAFGNSPQVFAPGKADLHQPLVLENGRLYLRRLWRDERSIGALVTQRASAQRIVDSARIKHMLDRLFVKPAGNSDIDWQKVACAVAARSGLAIITGGPGTGKTYTVARLLALMHALAPVPQRFRVALAAPSGKAAVRLKQSIDQALAGLMELDIDDINVPGLISALPTARTLHSLLGTSPSKRTVRHNADNLLEVDLLIVDEASMVDLEMMADLLEALPATATLILLGDKDQLSSVEAGAVLGDLCEGAAKGQFTQATADYVKQACGESLPTEMISGGCALSQCTIMLRTSRRFGGAIGTLAQAVNANQPETAASILRQKDQTEVMWYDSARSRDIVDLAMAGRSGAEGGYSHYLRLVQAGPQLPGEGEHMAWVSDVLTAYDTFRLLCAVRQGDWGVEGLNEAVEQRLLQAELIVRSGDWYAGRPVMVTRNDYGLGVFNGDVGIALPEASGSGRLRVYFQSGERMTSVLPSRLPHVETAYAMTVHKVQGSEFSHTVLVLPPTTSAVVVRELIYTGITRARRWFTLITPQALQFAEGISRQTRRASGLRLFIDET